MRVTGVVGKPEIARSNRSNQIFFVNERFVKDKTLMGATENSFKGLLPIGKYGFLVLNIDMDPSMVDVNVHPAKLEVRFQEENKVFKAIYHAIKDTLLKAELVANTEKTIDEIENNAPTKSSITDLFRKIKSQEIEKPQENVIEQIYNNREETKISKEEPKAQKLNSNPEAKTISNEDKKMDVFKELIAMQQRLKKEAESNPNIHTNIDTLIKDTKKLQEGEEITDKQEISNVFKSSINTENDLETILKEDIKNDKITLEKEENVISISNEEQVEKLKEDEETYKTIEKGTIENIGLINNDDNAKENTNSEELTNQNIYSAENEKIDLVKNSNEEKITSLTDTENMQEEQNTQKFTSQELQDMIDKLETIDNVEESPEFANMYERIFGKLPASVEEEKRKEEEKISAYELIKDNNISVFEDIPEYQKPVYKIVGIAFNTYIIIEIKNELYIIDQHAAHERVMYEKVKKNYYSDEDRNSQMLLLPDIITLTHKEIDILKDNIEMFEKAGFVLEEFGDNTIKLTGVPDICIDLDIDTKELFLETLDEINQVARTAKQEIEERFIATVACKAAVKANMALTEQEVKELMDKLLVLPNPFTCPHGRPTAIKMTKYEIERKFARK